MTDELMAGAEPSYSAGGAAGVLLLHDLAGTPQPFHGLAATLSAANFAVELPLLPGHGTSIADLTETAWDDWAGAAQLALDELASRTGPVVVGGIGMGATLAFWVAAFHPAVYGVVAINPRTIPLPEPAKETFRAMLADGVATVSPLGPDVRDRTAHVLAYDTVPVAALLSMFDAVDSMSSHWGEFDKPTLLVTSARDHRVSPANAGWLKAQTTAPIEHLVLERSFHEATVDVQHEELETVCLDFVKRLMSGQLAQR